MLPVFKNNAQAGLFDEASRHGRFLEFKLKPVIDVLMIKQTLKTLTDYITGIEGLYCQLAFGSSCWDQLNPNWRPSELVPFTYLENSGLAMPASQGDILIWLHSSDAELLPQALITIYQQLEGWADLQLDLEGIKNKQSRDLIGFVDGTANPKDDKRLDVALIPDGELGAGGSYVISQRWQHDLNTFNHLAIHEQENVVGRTKEDDIELEGDAMPEDSHVSRTDVKVDGIGMKIYRRSSPYMSSQLEATNKIEQKNLPDHGLYFLAFACEMQRFTVQLDRMLGLTDDGISDKLMQYSKPKTGSYWFMPSASDLSLLF
jgi:putative iron-dependent peroxidase